MIGNDMSIRDTLLWTVLLVCQSLSPWLEVFDAIEATMIEYPVTAIRVFVFVVKSSKVWAS